MGRSYHSTMRSSLLACLLAIALVARGAVDEDDGSSGTLDEAPSLVDHTARHPPIGEDDEGENFIGLGRVTQAEDIYLGDKGSKADEQSGAHQTTTDAKSKQRIPLKSKATPLISLSGGAEFHIGADVKVRTVGQVHVSKDSKLAVSQHAQVTGA